MIEWHLFVAKKSERSKKDGIWTGVRMENVAVGVKWNGRSVEKQRSRRVVAVAKLIVKYEYCGRKMIAAK